MQGKQKEDRSFAVHGNNPPAKVIRRKLSWINRFIVNEEKTMEKGNNKTTSDST